MTLAKIIPLAFVMIAGPQILSAIFLATSEDRRGNSAAMVGSARVSITAIVTLAFLLSDGATKQGHPATRSTSSSWCYSSPPGSTRS